jgi:putative chitobiose transport system permease protein
MTDAAPQPQKRCQEPFARRGGRLKRFLTPYLFLAPAGAVLGVFVLWAMVQVVFYSFTRYTAFRGPDPVGLDNYRQLMSDGRFWFCLVNSFLYLLVTPAVILLSLQAALVVHASLRWAKGLRVLLFLPVVTPAIVAAIAWRLLLNEDNGLLNSVLGYIGVGPIDWLSAKPWTLISAMLVTLWRGFGYYMMIFLAGLVAVPRELEEAATIDGAGRAGVLWHVTMPALRPLITLVVVISSISALKVFDELYVTIRGAPISHQTVVPLIYDTAFERADYGYASAIGVVLFLVVLIFSLTQLRLTGADE